MSRFFSIMVVLLAGAHLLCAQELPRQVIFDHITIPRTIRSSEVVDIIQDPRGYIWIASNGLTRYDGHHFTIYDMLPDSSSISGQEVITLMYDEEKNRILAGTRTQGLIAYNYATNSLSRIPSDSSISYVNGLAKTSDGKIWATSFNSGVFHLHQDTLRKLNNRTLNRLNPAMPYAWKDYLLVSAGSRVMMLKGLEVVDSIPLSWNNKPIYAYARVTALAHDGKHSLYIGTEKKGVLVYDTDQRTFKKYFQPEISPFYNWINKIKIDRSGLVWMLTKSGGTVVYSPEKDSFITLKKNAQEPTSLSDDNCISILEDYSGIIWIGSLGDLNKYDKNKVMFKHITYNPFAINTLSDKMVRGIIEDDQGYILAGTDGGFINRIDPVTLKVQQIKVVIPGYEGIIVPLYFHPLDKNTMLVGSNVGILEMNRQKFTFRFFEPLQTLLKQTPTPVRQVIQRGNKLYMIASRRLLIYDLTTRELLDYSDKVKDPEKKIVNPTTLYLDSQQRIWLGVGGGVKLIDEQLSFTHYQLESASRRPDGNYFMVLSLQEINGKLWIGTFDSGIRTLDITQGITNPVIGQVKLPDVIKTTSIYSTLPDKTGAIWMSTNSGIIKYNPDNERFTFFSKSEGVQEMEFNRLAYARLSNGEIVFGGINGLNIFNPEEIKIQSTLVQPFLSSITLINNETFYKDLGNAGTVTLRANENSFTIRFVVPNFQQPARFTTEYMLQGHDQQWTKTDDYEVSYSNIKPGDYRFIVRVKDQEGKTLTAEMPVTISIPYWQTPWFISFVLSVFVLIIYTSFQWHSRKNIRDKQRLEKLLQERTKEIEKSRLELAALNQKKDLIFSILSHDLRGPLTTLKGFLNLLTDNTDTLAKEDIQRHAANIRNSLNNSLDLLDNTLYWSLTQTGNLQPNPEMFNLNDLASKMYKLYQLVAEQKNIRMNLHLNGKLSVFADQTMISVVLRNVISNAIKFTKPGKQIDIHVGRKGDQAVVTIIDEGIGMSNYYLEKLMSDDLPKAKNGTANEKGTGLGILLCRNFMKMNNGSFIINSIEKAGTECTIALPLAGYA